jgi:hypothetical protein
MQTGREASWLKQVRKVKRVEESEKWVTRPRGGRSKNFGEKILEQSTTSINTILSHMGILREINLCLRVSLAGHRFSGYIVIYKHRICILYTY